MSGPVANNIFRSSGIIAEAAGGLSWQPVVTASTLTASAGKGYFINTTSNACTITLPSSATAGDQIILIDYARTWGTNAITIDSNGLNFQGSDDTYIVDYDTSGQSLNLVYSGATIGWTPSSDIVNALEPVAPPTQKGIFAFGNSSGGVTSVSNLVNSSGVVATDTAGVGTARRHLAAASYGGDKAIFAFGYSTGNTNLSNLVSSSGVVATDTTGVGTSRAYLAGVGYGDDKAIFAYGVNGGLQNISNLVSNSGVVATDTTGVGTARQGPGASRYGSTGQAIVAFGNTGGSSYVNTRNLISNTGVVASDATGAGTARAYTNLGASYGGDKGIIAYGYTGSNSNISNLISNTGVVGSDVSGVGTARESPAATNYGGDKAIYAYGSGPTAISNLVSNTGVVSADVTGVGTARTGPAAAGYSFSA